MDFDVATAVALIAAGGVAIGLLGAAMLGPTIVRKVWGMLRR